MANDQIKFGIGFNVDKTGLNQIRVELQQIKNMTQGEFLKLNTKGTTSDLFAARRAAEELDDALNKAFNKELGTLNVAKFNQALKASDKTIDQLYADLSKCGTKGQQAFRNIATEALTTNRQLKQTHNLIDKMAETMGNTIKWGVASSVMNIFTGSVQKAYGYVKNLDSSLNDIRIVTGKSVEDMDKFAERASKASKALAASTTDYTEAALIYYQQGLADKEVQTRAETTLKAANVTGQSGREVSEQLTAVWNGYKVSAQETELYVDKLAAVAATTASDLEELSTGMSKVASAANAMGVDIDQLNGHLSTVISVTRQAPESVGTAFKTIYARLGDLAVSGEDEFGTSLGEVSGKLKQMGIEILDSQGQMRDMGIVIEEVAEKWNGWTDAQRQAAAVAMAGKRQYNNLIALFDNWDMYTEAVNTSANAMGTLQNQQNIYMDSTEAHLDIMKTSFEDLYDSLLSGDDIETFADAITKVVNGLTTFVDSIGGGANTLMLLGSVGTKVFSKQIAQGIGTTIQNLQSAKYNASQVQAEFELLEQFKGVPMADKALKDLVKWKGELLGFGKLVSTEQQNEANSIMKTRNALELKVEAWKENEQALDKYLKKAGQKTGIENVKRTPGGGTTEEYDKAHASLKEVEGTVQKLKNAYSGAEITSKRFNNALLESGGKLKENSVEAKKVEAAIKNMANKMKELSDKDLIPKGKYDEFAAALAKMSKMNPAERMTVGFKELKSIFINSADEVEAKNKQMFDLLEQEAQGWGNTLEKEISECETRWNNFTKNLKTVQATQQIINLVSGIGSLATAIQSLMNIKDIINNEDLSAGEKAVQIITALSTALTIGSLGVSTLSGSFVKLTGILGIYSAAQGTADGATKKHTISLLGQKGAADSLGGAFKDLLAQQIKLPGALAKIASKFGIASSGAISLGAALGIAAAAIGVVTVSAIALHKWYTKDARAAEEAAEAAQKASEAANSVKEAHQGVIDTLNKYDSATEKMNSVTKGTEEWNTALQEANSSVLELLNTFPELASGEGYFEKINGQLKLTEEGLDYIKEKSESMLTSTTAAANIANVESQKANINSDITNLSREIKVSKSVENYNAATGSSTTSYATTTGLDKEVIEKAIAAIQENGSAFLSNTSTIMEVVKVESNVANALKDIPTELIRLANSLDAIETSEDLIYEQTAASALQDNTQYQGLSGDAQGAVNQIVGDKLQAEVEKLAKSTFATMTDANEEAAKQFYGAQMSKEGEEKGTTDYLINGEWKTFADDVTLMSLATQEATKNIDTLAEETLKAGNELNNLNFDESIKAGLLGFAGGEVSDLSNLTHDQLGQLGEASGSISTDTAKGLGYESIEAFETKIRKSIEDELDRRAEQFEEDIKNSPQTLTDTIQNLSPEDLRNDQLEAINSVGGVGGLLESIDPSVFQEMMKNGIKMDEVLAEIDWSSLDTSDPAAWFASAFQQGVENVEYGRENEGSVEANYAADAEEYGFEEETYRNLTERIQETAEASEDYADTLKDQEDVAQEVAKEILRYDKALESVSENGENWMAVLEAGADQDIAENIGDIADAYGNMLDMDPDSFSNGFLESTENMKLMQEAAEGSEDAYNQLMEAARQDIATKVHFDDAEFQEGFTDLMGKYYEGQNLDDLEVGAKLNDEAFLDDLSNMVTEAGMSAQEAQNYLASMGIDAEVIEDTTDSTENNDVSSLIPTVTWDTKNWDIPLLGNVTLPVPKIDFDPVKKAFQNKKQFKAHSLKVKSASKSSGGDIKYKNSTHGAGSKGAASPSKKSGGGGSTPTKSFKTTQKKKDPFHDIDNELSKLETKFDRLGDTQDRLYGKNLLDNLNEQLDTLDKIVDKNKEKLKIAKDEVALMQKSQKNQRKGYFNDLNDFGVDFDSKTGEITNYEAIIDRLDTKVKNLHDKWNSLTAKQQEGDEGKALAKQIEQAEANRDTFEELVNQYDTYIYETIPGLEDTIREAAYQQIEIEIQAFKVEGQLYLDMSEALEQLKDFKQKMNEYLTYDELDIGYTDDGTDLALGGGSLLSEASISEKNVDANLEMLLGKVKTDKKGKPILDKDGNEVRDGLGLMGTVGDGTDSTVAVLTKELNGLQSEYEKYRQDPENYRGQFAKEGEDGEWYFDEAGFREAMQETSDNLDAEIQKVEEAYKENREALLNSIDLIGESYAQQMETYDFINDRIESQIEAAKLLGAPKDGWKDTSADNPNREANMEANASYNQYEGLQTYYEQASANAQAKADTAKEQMQLAYNNMNDPELSAEEREKWKAMYEESVAEYEDASFAAIEAYKAENENYVRMQADAAFGTDAELDLADAQWDIQTKLDDKYLDDIDKAYETQKLSRKLQQDMDGASLAAQQKLAKFRDEELEKLKEKDKLTQYDVDRANKLYEIELKKIALEEAQQNKSKMRLRRDSSGNYSYQFVADEDKTAEAEQALEDAQYGLREMDLEHQRELQEEMLEMQKEYKEKWIEYQLLSEEEQKAREAEYSAYFEYYQGELTNMSAQALETQDNLKESSFEVAKTLYSEDETNFKDLTDAQKEALRDKTKEFKDLTEEEKKAITEEGTGLMPTWNTAVTTMIDKFSGEGEDTFESKIKKAQGNVTIKQEELNGKITAAATGIQTAAQTAQDEATKKWLPAQKKVNEKLKTMNTRLSNANKYLKKQKEWWNKIKEEAQKAIEKTQTYLALTSKEEAGKTKTKTKTKTNGKNNTGENTDGKGTQGNGKVNKGDKVKLTGKLAESSYESPTLEPLKKYKGAQLYVQEINKGAKSPYHLGTSKDFDDEDTWVGWVNKAQISGYDTGGYTGSGWAPQDKDQGKLAFLHEKELILNSTDTQNILDLVYLLRKMNIEKDLSSATIGGTGVQNAMSANALEYSNRMIGALVTGIDNIVKTISLAKQDSQKLEQNVHITAEFPDVKEAEEIKLALNNLTNRASQYISNSRRR